MIIALTGAGLSTAAGIPDFRGPDGVWNRFDPDAFHIDRFNDDPDGFWRDRAQLIGAMQYLDAKPTIAHRALVVALRDQVVSRIVTQNVDGLHTAAGAPRDRVLELHGNGRTCLCTGCGAREATVDVIARISDTAPTCACGGILRPDVVLFGEPVPAMMDAAAWVASAEHLLAAGSSLQVHPAAGLVEVALQAGLPVTICNDEPTPYDQFATCVRGDVQALMPAWLTSLRR